MIAAKYLTRLSWAAALLALGCAKPEKAPPLDLGHDFFPLELGREYIYAVDSFIFRTIAGGLRVDTVRLWRREFAFDSLSDDTGAAVYRFERSERYRPDAPWTPRGVFSAQREATRAMRTEENLRLIPLIFPPLEGRRWNGNQYVASDTRIIVAGESLELFKGWDYRILSGAQAETIGERNYESVVAVRMADFESLVERRLVIEKYARGVGLVYREYLIADTQCRQCCAGNTSQCLDIDWFAKAEKGFLMRQTLIDFR
jgi:hypothetical protein